MKIWPFNFELKLFKSPKQEEEIGDSGTSIWDGFISDEDYVSELTGSNALTVYDKMRKSDGVVKAALLACELPIRAANWYIEPASDDDKDREVADFVSECLFDKMTITWDDFLRQAILMLPFGFSVFEKVFTNIDFQGKQMIGWRKFAPRLQKTILKWKTDAGEDGIVQTLPVGGKPNVSIPIEKLLIFTHDKEGDNWLGISVLRSAYRPWFFKNHMEKVNAMAFERQGMGIPSGSLPKGYTKADKDKMKTLLMNLRANEQAYMIKPADWEVEFMDMKAGTLKDPDESVRRYNREILISVLAQFLDLGSGKSGSRALSADHSSAFHNNLTAVAQGIRDVINKYAIKQLVDLNYTVAYYPTLEFSNIGMAKYEAVAKAMSSLIQHGAIKPDPKLEDWLRQLMNAPEKPEEEEVDEEKPNETPKQKELKPDDEEKKKASEFYSWRSLTFAERKVKFSDIQRVMNQAETKLKSVLNSIMMNVSNNLIRQLQIVLEAPNSTEKSDRLKAMTVHYQKDYRGEVFTSTKDMFQYGKMSASNEMNKTPPPSPAESIQDISKQADALTAVMANDMLGAGKMALLLGLQQKKSATEILRRIKGAIRKESGSVLNNVPSITVNGAINQGRRSVFKFYEKDIYALQRSEILDQVTCNYCMSIDRRIFRKNDSFTRNDGIHSNCRGIWVEIMKEETDKPKIAGMPISLRDSFETVNVFKPPLHPIIKK